MKMSEIYSFTGTVSGDGFAEPWWLYPDQLFEEGKTYKIKITIEEVKESLGDSANSE